MPYFMPYLDESGIHAPTYQDRLQALMEQYRTIFGQDIYLGEDTQDYQLLSLFAKAMDDMTALLIDVYNARNPAYATGNSLDMLMPLSGIKRMGATCSTVMLTLTGTPGAVLPAGMQAKDSSGSVWRIPGTVTIDGSGTAKAAATCTTAGARQAPPHTITRIDTPTAAWLAVTNEAAASAGRDVETDAALRERRNLSVSIPSRSILEGIRASVLNLPGVTRVAVVENTGSAADTNGLPPHSFCVVAEGGADQEIARTIYLKKAPGVGTHGTTSAVYTDVYGGQNTIRFSRPETVPMTVKIKIRKLAGWNDEIIGRAIPEAVVSTIRKLKIGEGFIVTSLYAAILDLEENGAHSFAVTGITASTAAQGETGDTVNAAYNQQLTAEAGDVNMVFV